ncbi:DUF1700 domain-containing protein [Candidatus Avoscillospira sp. LCP25S3_F1]|uniref:DUF1700 domain-containing protein n=1 Tax=Candidatus Avoscillospira sp. LCP25S3_F1 TaxID=3438825 RepID=UPI003F8DD3BD
MDKQTFLARLRTGLSGLPQEDMEERLTFYSEMIDDRVEEGCTEAEAVAEIGPVEAVLSQIVAEIPLTKLVKEKVKPKHTLRPWEIVLLLVGSPLWLSLLVSAAAIVLSFYIVVWSVILSLWLVESALIGCALSGVVLGVVFAGRGNVLAGIAVVGVGLTCAGLSIFLFFGCKEVTKGILRLTGQLILGLKNCFVKKEAAA